MARPRSRRSGRAARSSRGSPGPRSPFTNPITRACWSISFSPRAEADALIINPAGCSFTSVALYDAMKAFDGPIFEVHISNIHARDELHRHSRLSPAVKGVIAGLGPYGYIVAMQAALHGAGQLPATLPAAL